MAKKKFYITTAIDYVNAEPHIGHGYQKIIADVLARWHKLKGEDVFFLTGTDEHGQKIANSAKEKGKEPKEYVDSLAIKFEESWKLLNIDFDKFVRTTDDEHKKRVKEFIKLLEKKGDIYKGDYSGLYCEGCEAYITEKDCIDGKCKFHPNKELQKLKEEAYFFRLSKYQKKLLELYKTNSNYILPKFRKQEIINRVKDGLNDLSITRNKDKLTWGIDFPLDNKFVIYVWTEALLNYITALDWPNGKNFKKYWPADVEILGIDNGWFHTVIWPAMLISAGIKPANTILINGFLTFNNQKISKSLGNTISPINLVKKYNSDSIRYFVARNFVFGQDGDFSEQALIERNNNELADKLGNLISRVSALIEKNSMQKCKNNLSKKINIKNIEKLIENYEFDKALNEIFAFIDVCNEYAQNKKPWENKKDDKKILYELADSIKIISILLYPFIPESCEKISKNFGFKIELNEIKKPLKIKKIKKSEILFKKIENSIEIKSEENKKINKALKTEGIMSIGEVNFSDWEKLELRVGKIEKAEDIENADKIYKLTVNIGTEEKIVCAGLKKHYKKEKLIGKRCILFVNLAPRIMRGIESQGMVLASVNEDESEVRLIQPDSDVEIGSRVR